MITEISRGITTYMGLSTDTKPAWHEVSTGVYEGEPENMSIFLEADTGDKYYYDVETHD
ncbi:MAG: hypothetical protein Q4F31_10060 [Eubacteriales bacterium]|nr:hypothetical protein [Eubacteriales bacterium]